MACTLMPFYRDDRDSSFRSDWHAIVGCTQSTTRAWQDERERQDDQDDARDSAARSERLLPVHVWPTCATKRKPPPLNEGAADLDL